MNTKNITGDESEVVQIEIEESMLEPVERDKAISNIREAAEYAREVTQHNIATKVISSKKKESMDKSGNEIC